MIAATTIETTERKLREVCNAAIALDLFGKARYSQYRAALLDYYAEPQQNRDELGEVLEGYAKAGDLRSYMHIAEALGYL